LGLRNSEGERNKNAINEPSMKFQK
jgi:hypothetical protein